MTPKEVLAFCREKDVKAVDLRFVDLPGAWQHFTIPVHKLTERLFEEGLGFDGARIRGWHTVPESDMLLVPQPDTAFLDPFTETHTLVMIGNVQDPITREDDSRDPRHIARKSANYLLSTGIADRACFAPESEFFVFDDVRFDQRANEGYYHLDSGEAEWNRGRRETPNLGHKVRHHGGYLPVAPIDQLVDLRSEMMQCLIDSGIDVECQHHAMATAGQCEITLRHDQLVRMADHMLLFKYVVKNVARRHGKTVTFMPKPLFGDNGSGMHTHISLWKDEQPLFAGSGYAGLSEIGLYAVGGILRHAPALLAFTNPSTNSYKRLVPGAEAPVHLAYSQRNLPTACRVPMTGSRPSAKRVEFRCPDSSCNPYLAFAALLMAIIDGIQNRINPGEPLENRLEKNQPPRIDRDPFDLQREEFGDVPQSPGSLEQALTALEQDHDFLLPGDVFTPDVIDTWIDFKRRNEVDALRLRPHPYEFCLYYDI